VTVVCTLKKMKRGEQSISCHFAKGVETGSEERRRAGCDVCIMDGVEACTECSCEDNGLQRALIVAQVVWPWENVFFEVGYTELCGSAVVLLVERVLPVLRKMNAERSYSSMHEVENALHMLWSGSESRFHSSRAQVREGGVCGRIRRGVVAGKIGEDIPVVCICKPCSARCVPSTTNVVKWLVHLVEHNGLCGESRMVILHA
jgi:hypothetical protein